ncbi:MAG: hypothetical protein A3K19_01450 [Lentisphaerae bacterium RIFOXYB12_FULL_65_16]|nr:MAG: hypothetical protein A3K18_22805 [Lentisphaerae bacterium RIFOXYA12_64_32]OGV92806.1 MAG: hypothetical protein A3K19_01450 [Lentisphaerae bacterium RIFOXYB12_FULL_65_16]
MHWVVEQLQRPGRINVSELCRDVLTEWTDGLEKNTAALRIPRVRDQFRVIPGTHFHLEPEVFVQISGYTLFQFPQERVWAWPGEICVVPRGMPHGETVGACDGPFFNLVIARNRDRISFHLASERGNARPGIMAATPFQVQVDPSGIFSHLDDATHLFHRGTPASGRAARALVTAALACLAEVAGGTAEPGKPEHPKISRCRQVVMVNLSDPGLCVAAVAESLQCSADYLSHLFHKETGTPLALYINQRRVEHARTLLEKTALNVKEVAYAAGYRDPGYFARVFRRLSGQSPKAYRRENSAPT